MGDGIRSDNQGIETVLHILPIGPGVDCVTEYAPTIRGLKLVTRSYG